MYSLLYVEDEPAIAKGVIRGLEAEGYRMFWARSAEDGRAVLHREEIDLILLDVRLPNMDGFTFCRSIRAEGVTAPIIMLTARDEEVDRVLGLELGADDYLVKPFSLRELISRVRAQIRRAYGELAPGVHAAGRTITAGPLRIDRHSLRVFKHDSEVYLTPIELRILLSLAESAGVTLTRSVLIEHAWGRDYFLEDERTVDVHIRHLREKIEDDPSRPELIQTVRGYGYRFVAKS
jgi:DNA-binding response OmpR family regulator